MHDVELFNGFANRFLWPLTHRVKSLPSPPDYSPMAATHAQWWVQAVYKARVRGDIHRDHHAEKQWATVYDQLRDGERPGLPPRQGFAREVCARAQVMVLRMALNFAALEGSDVITPAHQDAALAVWDYCERCAAYLFGELAGDPVENVVADALRSRGRMSRSDLLRLFSRHLPTGALQTALDALVHAGKVRQVKEQTGGRSVEMWEWIA
jgi:hypothetical protein